MPSRTPLAPTFQVKDAVEIVDLNRGAGERLRGVVFEYRKHEKMYFIDLDEASRASVRRENKWMPVTNLAEDQQDRFRRENRKRVRFNRLPKREQDRLMKRWGPYLEGSLTYTKLKLLPPDPDNAVPAPEAKVREGAGPARAKRESAIKINSVRPLYSFSLAAAAKTALVFSAGAALAVLAMLTAKRKDDDFPVVSVIGKTRQRRAPKSKFLPKIPTVRF